MHKAPLLIPKYEFIHKLSSTRQYLIEALGMNRDSIVVPHPLWSLYVMMAFGDDRPCAPKLGAYYSCLGANGHQVSQCLEQESELLKCSNADKSNDYCLDELKQLFKCTSNPTSDGCAKQFINFRECHRPGGREILVQDGFYMVAPEHANKYMIDGDVICPTRAPQRSTNALKATLDKLSTACGFKNLTEQFKPSVKS